MRKPSLASVVKQLGGYRVASISPREPNDGYVDVGMGDMVSWRHKNRYLRGRVIGLVESGVDWQSMKPSHVPKKRWRVSRDWPLSKRVIVEVCSEDGEPPTYYTVAHNRLAVQLNHLIVMERETRSGRSENPNDCDFGYTNWKKTLNEFSVLLGIARRWRR